MKNKLRQTSTESSKAVTKTTLASMNVEIVPTISEALFTMVKTEIQTNRFDTDLAGYPAVALGIINEILRCKTKSN